MWTPEEGESPLVPIVVTYAGTGTGIPYMSAADFCLEPGRRGEGCDENDDCAGDLECWSAGTGVFSCS